MGNFTWLSDWARPVIVDAAPLAARRSVLVVELAAAKKGVVGGVETAGGDQEAAELGVALGARQRLAAELGPKARVNAIGPGLIKTDMIEGVPVEELAKRIPMRRLGTPEEVAATVCFLFSEGAGYITGQVLSVNGGML